MSITLERLIVSGFRAYLKPESFAFRRGKHALSLSIFAPNAQGKSSLVDAFEFYFSNDATLERLGVKAVDRQAGRNALEHIAAEENAVQPSVEFEFREGATTFGDPREPTRQGTPLTPAAQRVLVVLFSSIHHQRPMSFALLSKLRPRKSVMRKSLPGLAYSRCLPSRKICGFFANS